MSPHHGHLRNLEITPTLDMVSVPDNCPLCRGEIAGGTNWGYEAGTQGATEVLLPACGPWELQRKA